MSVPRVSILIPTYNRAGTISIALQSALNQDLGHIEVIVSDNDSTDLSLDHIRSFNDSRIKLIRQDSNIGMALNWIECIKHARGEWIAFLMSDDLFLNNCIAYRFNLSTFYPDAIVIQSMGMALPLCDLSSALKRDEESYQALEHFSYDEIICMLSGRPSPYPSNPCSFLIKTEFIKQFIESVAFRQYLIETSYSGHCLDHMLLYGTFLMANRGSFIRTGKIDYVTSIHPLQDSSVYGRKIFFLIAGNFRAAALLCRICKISQIRRVQIMLYHFYSALRQLAYSIFKVSRR